MFCCLDKLFAKFAKFAKFATSTHDFDFENSSASQSKICKLSGHSVKNIGILDFNRQLISLKKHETTPTKPLAKRPLVWLDGQTLEPVFTSAGLKKNIDPNAKLVTLDAIKDIFVNSLITVIERCQELGASDETIASIKKIYKKQMKFGKKITLAELKVAVNLMSRFEENISKFADTVAHMPSQEKLLELNDFFIKTDVIPKYSELSGSLGNLHEQVASVLDFFGQGTALKNGCDDALSKYVCEMNRNLDEGECVLKLRTFTSNIRMLNDSTFNLLDQINRKKSELQERLADAEKSLKEVSKSLFSDKAIVEELELKLKEKSDKIEFCSKKLAEIMPEGMSEDYAAKFPADRLEKYLKLLLQIHESLNELAGKIEIEAANKQDKEQEKMFRERELEKQKKREKIIEKHNLEKEEWEFFSTVWERVEFYCEKSRDRIRYISSLDIDSERKEDRIVSCLESNFLEIYEQLKDTVKDDAKKKLQDLWKPCEAPLPNERRYLMSRNLDSTECSKLMVDTFSPEKIDHFDFSAPGAESARQSIISIFKEYDKAAKLSD